MFKFKSFISYSRAADARLAPEIKSALQNFAKPWYKLRSIHIFCDQTNLTASPALWDSIKKNLDDSEYFIYLASPKAAASAWVTKEITAFYQRGAANKILIVLTDGDIVWDDTSANFNWNLTTAIPQLEHNIFKQEPLWVDLRWIRKELLSPRDPRFLDVIANLSSVIRQVDKDTLIGKDVEEYHKAKRFRLFSMTGISLLALFFIAATFVAVRSGRISQERLVKTFTNNGINLLFAADYTKAVHWFIGAYANEKSDTKNETNKYRLQNLFNQVPVPLQVWQPDLPILKTAFISNDRLLLVTGEKEHPVYNTYACLMNGNKACKASIQVLSATTGNNIFKPIILNDGVRTVATNNENTLIATVSINNVLRIWNLADGRLITEHRLAPPLNDDAYSCKLLFNKQSDRILFSHENTISVFETATGNIVAEHKDVNIINSGANNVAFLEDGVTVIFIDVDLKFWNIDTKKLTARKLRFFDSPEAFKLSPDYKNIVFFGTSNNKHFQGFGPSVVGLLAYCSTANMEEALFVKTMELNTGGVKLEFNTAGTVLAVNSGNTSEGGTADHGTRVYNTLNGNPLSDWIKLSSEVDISADSSGETLAVSCGDGTTEIWTITPADGQQASKKWWLLHDGNEITKSVFSSDQNLLLTVSSERLVKLWKIPGEALMRFGIKQPVDNFNNDTLLKWGVSYGTFEDKNISYNDSSLAFVYDANNGRLSGEPLKHNSQVYQAAISGDGKYIITAAANETCIWKGDTHQKLYNLSFTKIPFIVKVSFSPRDHKFLLSFADYTCRVYDAETGRPVGPFITHPFSASYVDQADASFSADGTTIITSDYETMWFWDASSGEPLSAPLKSGYDTTGIKINSHPSPSVDVEAVSIEDLKRYSELLSGQRLDESSSFVPLSAKEYMTQWKKWKSN